MTGKNADDLADGVGLDRGLQFGDGLFETVWLDRGQPLGWDWHWVRFAAGCGALALPLADPERIRSALIDAWIAADRPIDALAKWVWTAGNSASGYVRPAIQRPNLFVQCRAATADPLGAGSEDVDSSALGLHGSRSIGDATDKSSLAKGASVVSDASLPLRVITLSSVCASIQPGLAGFKHLNRLDQVLARSRLDQMIGSQRTEATSVEQSIECPVVHDALLCDADARLVCATAANIALRIDGKWLTPEHRGAGVAGTRRAAWLAVAESDSSATSGGARNSDEVMPQLHVAVLDEAVLESAEAMVVMGTGVGLQWVDELRGRDGATIQHWSRNDADFARLPVWRRALRARLNTGRRLSDFSLN
ncbi:MAG: aminotransferase class IV [Thioalkalivibrionaceae bacterium]